MQNTGIQNLNHLYLSPGNELRAIESLDNKISNIRPSQQKSWMINIPFKCPVIGTCLNLEEQKKILKKAGYSTKNLSPYKMHHILVESLENENDISTRIDAYLNRKFHREISIYLYLDESDFLKEWKAHFEKGFIEGLLWVAATRADLSLSALWSIFGDIHMQMHLNSEQNRKERQNLAYQREENRKISQRLDEVIQINRGIKKEKERIEKKFTELQRADLILEKEKKEIGRELNQLQEKSFVETLRAENRQLHATIEELSRVTKDYNKQVRSLKDQNNKLLSKLDRQRELNAYLKKETEKNIQQISNQNQPSYKHQSFDLGNKRILIVGGIIKFEAFYRKLIEEKGGIFEYHDGYMNGGINGLENKIRRADVVLCPVNCNSHNASSMVKRLAKKYSKSVQMLANSSLSRISQALFEYQKSVRI